jgi:predicted ArsR family transcriptional regulator
MSDTVQCGCCGGLGRVALGMEYQRTINLLRKQRGPINAADLARLDGCAGEAMCNRLVRLEEHGLATGERRGRQRLWRAK